MGGLGERTVERGPENSESHLSLGPSRLRDCIDCLRGLLPKTTNAWSGWDEPVSDRSSCRAGHGLKITTLYLCRLEADPRRRSFLL